MSDVPRDIDGEPMQIGDMVVNAINDENCLPEFHHRYFKVDGLVFEQYRTPWDELEGPKWLFFSNDFGPEFEACPCGAVRIIRDKKAPTSKEVSDIIKILEPV
jgi:hypothetical protein